MCNFMVYGFVYQKCTVSPIHKHGLMYGFVMMRCNKTKINSERKNKTFE